MTPNRLALTVTAGLLVLLAAACGDDGPQTEPEIGDGPAEDISGVWQGDYNSVETPQRTGVFCWVIEQDGRSVQGAVAFDGGAPVDAAGLVVEGNVQLVWGSRGAGTSTPATTGLTFASGGTLTGIAAGGGASGTYSSLDADRGEWRANRVDGATCG